jgi:hypothetical protein
MITNVTITQINVPTDPAPDGTQQFASGGAVKIRCNRDKPTIRQRIEIQNLKVDATDVVYIPAANLPNRPVDGTQLYLRGDWEQSPLIYVVRACTPQIKLGGLEHWMCYCEMA